jgi:hypothetical protein
MIHFSSGQYALTASIGALPPSYARYIEHASLHEKIGGFDSGGDRLFFAVSEQSKPWPSLVVEMRFQPGGEAGFYPSFVLVPEHHVIFVGAGAHVLAYELAPVRRLCEDHVQGGCLAWRRHGDLVIMSGELELTAWSLQGQKLWSTGVEPPWDYRIVNSQIELEVMGAVSTFSVVVGPNGPSGKST